MLSELQFDRRTAAEILEETKKFYVKTQELRERRIDSSAPRLFKSPSEEEMEQIVNGRLRPEPVLHCPIPSFALRPSRSFCSPTVHGTAFCIAASTEPVHRMNSFTTSATSAFHPVIRNPPRPPKSNRTIEMQRCRSHLLAEDASTSSAEPHLPPKPIPPPRRSLMQQDERPIPPPRNRSAMTRSLHALNVPVPVSSPPAAAHNDSVINVMSASWFGPIGSTKELQPLKSPSNRIRIPVKPNHLTVTVLHPKAGNVQEVLQKKLSTPTRSPEHNMRVKRSMSSVIPGVHRPHYHSPGATSGVGSGSGGSLSGPSVSDFPSLTAKHVLSSPTASKDSGALDCSNVGSEVDECEIKHVDKDFEERIRHWDSRSLVQKRPSPVLSTFRTDKPAILPRPRTAPKEPTELRRVNSFFDRCGLPLETTSDDRSVATDDNQSFSVDSNFTSITHNKPWLEPSDKEPVRDGEESDAVTAQPKSNTLSKPVSMIEKNARVIQWIHGCSLASTVC